MLPFFQSIAQTPSDPVLWDAPLTTGAVFVALTGAITYLYRARDRDRHSEHDRLIHNLEQLQEELRDLRKRQQ
jgi:signal transduction protein with GAF and PtsI domain